MRLVGIVTYYSSLSQQTVLPISPIPLPRWIKIRFKLKSRDWLAIATYKDGDLLHKHFAVSEAAGRAMADSIAATATRPSLPLGTARGLGLVLGARRLIPQRARPVLSAGRGRP